MPRHIHARWLIPIDLSVSLPGILLYSQLDRIFDLRLDIAVLNTASILGLILIVLGLLVVSIDALIWA